MSKLDSAYAEAYSKTLDDIKKDVTQVQQVTSKHDQSFAAFVGCTPTVMAAIDKLYEDADQAHAALVSALNAKFLEVTTKRSGYLLSLLDKKKGADEARAYLQGLKDRKVGIKCPFDALDALDALQTQLFDGIDAKIKEMLTESEDVTRVMTAWFGSVAPSLPNIGEDVKARIAKVLPKPPTASDSPLDEVYNTRILPVSYTSPYGEGLKNKSAAVEYAEGITFNGASNALETSETKVNKKSLELFKPEELLPVATKLGSMFESGMPGIGMSGMEVSSRHHKTDVEFMPADFMEHRCVPLKNLEGMYASLSVNA